MSILKGRIEQSLEDENGNELPLIDIVRKSLSELKYLSTCSNYLSLFHVLDSSFQIHAFLKNPSLSSL